MKALVDAEQNNNDSLLKIDNMYNPRKTSGLWVAMDKNGDIHISDLKPYKPSDRNPNHNDEIFTFERNCDFFIRIYDKEIINILIKEGLSFESSPRAVKGLILS